MFCRGALQGALDSLEQVDVMGARAHALGSSLSSIESRLQDFRLSLDLVEKQIAQAQISPQGFAEETLLATRTVIHDQISATRLWLQRSNLYRYELIRQACNELKSLQYVDDPDDEDNFYVSTDFLLVSIARPKETHDKALEVVACVNNADQLLISRMEAECRELHRAIEVEDLDLVVGILRHVLTRSRSLLVLQPSEMSKLELMAEYGFQGKEVFQYNGSRRCDLNYEVNSNGLIVYVLQITPPLPAIGRIAHSFATPEQCMMHQSHDLALLLRTLGIKHKTCVITQTSKRYGKSIGLFALEEDGNGAESGGGDDDKMAPLFGRLESFDRQVVETKGVEFVKRQHVMNELLASCFVQPATAATAAVEDKVKHLYSVKVNCYPGGLWLKLEVSGEVSYSFDLYIDVETLSVNVEMQEDGTDKMDQLQQSMSTLLQQGMCVPEICHFCVAVFALRAPTTWSSSPRLESTTSFSVAPHAKAARLDPAAASVAE